MRKISPPTGIRAPDRPARGDLVPGAMAGVRAQEKTTRGSGGAVGASLCEGNISPALERFNCDGAVSSTPVHSSIYVVTLLMMVDTNGRNMYQIEECIVLKVWCSF